MVVEWDYENPGDGTLLVKVPTPVYSLCLNPDSQQLYVGSREGNLHVIDLQSRQEVRNIVAHAGRIFDTRILPGNRLLTCGADGQVCIWSLSDFSLIRQLNHAEKSARVSAFNEDKGLLAIGYSDHRIRLFNLADLSPCGRYRRTYQLRFCPELFAGRGIPVERRPRCCSAYMEIPARALHWKKEIPAHWYHINHISL